LSFAFSAEQFNTQRNIQRGVAITLLVCIHVAAIALLLTVRDIDAPLPSAVREIVLSFPSFHPKPVPVRLAHSRRLERTRGIILPIYKSPSELAVPTTQPDLSGVGHTLFGCDPAAMKNPDEQAGCSALAAKPPPEEVGMPKRSHVVQTARWMNELAIKQSHRRVPCIGSAPGPGGGAGFMIDFVCVGKGLLNGFGEPK
jgi:hypothetical protein